MSLNRRKFLRNSALTTAAISVPDLVLKSWGSVPATPHFNFGGAGGELWSEVALHDITVMQSFGFDNVNSYVFTLQLLLVVLAPPMTIGSPKGWRSNGLTIRIQPLP